MHIKNCHSSIFKFCISCAIFTLNLSLLEHIFWIDLLQERLQIRITWSKCIAEMKQRIYVNEHRQLGIYTIEYFFQLFLFHSAIFNFQLINFFYSLRTGAIAKSTSNNYSKHKHCRYERVNIHEWLYPTPYFYHGKYYSFFWFRAAFYAWLLHFLRIASECGTTQNKRITTMTALKCRSEHLYERV